MWLLFFEYLNSFYFPCNLPSLTLSLLFLSQILGTKINGTTLWVRQYLFCWFAFLYPSFTENDCYGLTLGIFPAIPLLYWKWLLRNNPQYFSCEVAEKILVWVSFSILLTLCIQSTMFWLLLYLQNYSVPKKYTVTEELVRLDLIVYVPVYKTFNSNYVRFSLIEFLFPTKDRVMSINNIFFQLTT